MISRCLFPISCWNLKTKTRFRRVFVVCDLVSISRILYPTFVRRQVFIWDENYSSPQAAHSTKSSPALHLGKDFAVAPSRFSAKLTLKLSFRGARALSRAGVSVRTSWITPDGRYPLPLSPEIFSRKFPGKCSDFPLVSKTYEHLSNTRQISIPHYL